MRPSRCKRQTPLAGVRDLRHEKSTMSGSIEAMVLDHSRPRNSNVATEAAPSHVYTALPTRQTGKVCHRFYHTAPERQAKTSVILHSGPSPHGLPGASAVLCAEARGTPPGPDATDMPDACPTCGRAYDLFDHDTSRLLDWVARLHQDLHHLKAAIEKVLL